MTRKNWSRMLLSVIIFGCLCSCSQFSQQTPTATVPASTSTLTPVVSTTIPPSAATERAFKQTETAHAPTNIVNNWQTATAYEATYDALSTDVTYVQSDKADWVTYNTDLNSELLPRDSITIASNGEIWVVGRGVVSKFDGSDWMTYLIPDGKDSNDASYTTTDIAIGLDNSVWVGGNNYPLLRFDGTTWQIELEDVSVVDIEINPVDGTVWVAENGVGIKKYDGINWTIYTSEDGVISNRDLDITIDNQGIVWVISMFGISSYDGQVWNKYPNELFCAEPNCEAALQFPTSIIAASDGSIWFTFNGVALFHYIDGDWERYDNKTLFMGVVMGFPPIHMCFSPDGNLWLGKYGQYNLSLSYFDGEDLVVPYMLSDSGKKLATVDTINDIACADDGSIWIASASMGVVHYIP